MGEKLISLLSEALHERIATPLPEPEELDCLMNEAIKHGVAAALSQAIPEGATPYVLKLQAKLNAVDMLQKHEGAELLGRMAECGVDCIPLKGWVLCEAYPRPYMRTMGDLDILLHSEQLQQAEKVMTELGYVREKDNFTDYHVCYTKPPCMTVELHVRLTEKDSCTFFDNVWERAILKEDGCFQLCDEDSYLFMVYHGAKHALLGGIGVRYIMDMWVFLHRLAGSSVPIQKELVSEGLDRLGLTSFAAYSEKLAVQWFGETGISLSAAMVDTEAMCLWHDYVLSSGAFGDVLSSYENQLKGNSKLALAISKAFPCRAQMEIRYPELRKKPLFLPMFWIKRLWEKLRGGEALNGAFALSSASRKACENREYLLTHLGLF